jgi:glycosyltransferase involved in cell wall biosynthesis
LARIRVWSAPQVRHGSDGVHIVLVYQHFMVSGVGSTKPYDLARALVAAGHEVTVLCGRGYLSQGMEVPRGLLVRLEMEGFRVLCVGVDYRQQMGFGRRVLAFLAFTLMAMRVVLFMPRYDVLVASSTPLTVGLAGLVSRYVRRRPWVFELRDLWPEYPVRAGFLKNRFLIDVSTYFEEWFYRSAAAVPAISRRMGRRLVERGVPAEKIAFIPTGVDLAAFTQAAPDRAWRAEAGLRDSDFVAVYVGSHGPSNGLGYVLDAAEHLRDRPDLRIVLIGDGSQKPQLVAEARRRGLENLLFLPPVARSRIPGILKACDAALMIYWITPGMEYEMPNKFFDYLAAGLPTITNMPAELWDHLEEAGCGIMADTARPEELARALEALQADPVRAREMGRRALALAADRFDRKGLHETWRALLERVAAASAGVASLGEVGSTGTKEGPL